MMNISVLSLDCCHGLFTPAEDKVIIFYPTNSSAKMKDQPLDRRSEVVSIYKCPPQIFGAFPLKFWVQKNKIFDHVFATSALDIAYLRNETSHRQTKMLVSIYNMCPKSWPTFRDLWPRYSWDPFAHCDVPFGGQYIATIMRWIMSYGFCSKFHTLSSSAKILKIC